METYEQKYIRAEKLVSAAIDRVAATLGGDVGLLLKVATQEDLSAAANLVRRQLQAIKRARPSSPAAAELAHVISALLFFGIAEKPAQLHRGQNPASTSLDHLDRAIALADRSAAPGDVVVQFPSE